MFYITDPLTILPCDLLKLNSADRMFLLEFDRGKIDEEFFARQTIFEINFLIKISTASPTFDFWCRQTEFSSLWNKMYTELGLFLTDENPSKFFPHDSPHIFELVKGAYLFHIAQIIRKAHGKPYAENELSFLRKAIECFSIHAVQEYNNYLFHSIETGKIEGEDDVKEALLLAIFNCKKVLPFYGSYADLMLADSYFRYAQWAQAAACDTTDVQRAIDAAVQACELAALHLTISQHSIHNASLGKGLSYSNVLGFDEPEAAKKALSEWQDQNVGRAHIP